MKCRSFHAAVCGALLMSSGIAAAAEVAGGAILGEPTGFSLRINNFPVLAFGWALTREQMFINCDYWLLNRPIPDADPLYWYLGVGGALGIGGHEGAIGCRVPVGFQAVFQRRYEIFGEFALGLSLVPDVRPFGQGGIGFRYIF